MPGWVMEQLLDFILPRHCLVCGLFAGRENFCVACSAELPRAGDACRQCALPLPDNPGATCGACLTAPPPWDRAVAAFDYRYPVRQLVQRFKFNRSLASGEALADELRRVVRSSGRRPDVIAPVPLHGWRFLRRGYNQADVLARRLSRDLEVRVDAGLLQRCRRTAAQSGLDAVERRRNVRGAFRVARRRRASVPPCVALVDDVMTTGATLEACTRALLQAGASSVLLWIVARATPP